MKLRSFLYLDTGIVDEYYAAINGGLYDEELQAISSKNNGSLGAGLNTKILNATGSKSNVEEETVTRSLKNVYASKFDTIYKYVSTDDDEQLLYYELLNEDSFNSLTRDCYIEVPVKARFSRLKDFTDSARLLGDLVSAFEPLFGEDFVDDNAKESIQGLNVLGEMTSNKGAACVFEFEDRKFPLIAYIKEEYIKCSREQFLNEGYLFCKVIKKIPKGQKIELDEVFDSVVKLASNREERRKLQKSAKNPSEIRDVIKGPALMVLPIAFYH